MKTIFVAFYLMFSSLTVFANSSSPANHCQFKLHSDEVTQTISGIVSDMGRGEARSELTHQQHELFAKYVTINDKLSGRDKQRLNKEQREILKAAVSEANECDSLKIITDY